MVYCIPCSTVPISMLSSLVAVTFQDRIFLLTLVLQFTYWNVCCSHWNMCCLMGLYSICCHVLLRHPAYVLMSLLSWKCLVVSCIFASYEKFGGVNMKENDGWDGHLRKLLLVWFTWPSTSDQLLTNLNIRLHVNLDLKISSYIFPF